MHKVLAFDPEELIIGKRIADIIERDTYLIILFTDGSSLDIYYDPATRPYACFRQI